MEVFKTTLPDGRAAEVAHDDMVRYAEAIGLEDIAPSRYSKLFAFKLFLHEVFDGLERDFVLEELKALEGQSSTAPNTKPSTQFTHEPLKGLWHKHFFSALFLGRNIATHMNHKKLERTIARVLDPTKSPVVTRKMVHDLAHEVTEGALRERENQNKLTGEWIVFAKHNGQNYYLTIAKHPSDPAIGDQVIFDEIRSIAYKQFPFLDAH